MYDIKIIISLLSILYTLEKEMDNKKEINRLNEILKKYKHKKSIKNKDIDYVIYLSFKYQPFIKDILSDDKDSISKLSLINDISYNYYKSAFVYSSMLPKNNPNLYIKEIEKINKDIEELNNNYIDIYIVNNLLYKYEKFINSIFYPFTLLKYIDRINC